jgi:uncharacterized membrane protein
VIDLPALARRSAPAFVAAASTAWLAALLAAPWALTRPDGSVGARGTAIAIFLAGRHVCHQRPERSFHLSGVPMPVCARCTGLYAGLPVGFAAGFFSRRLRSAARTRPRSWVLAAAVPTLASVGLELVSGLTSGPSRAFTAAALGAALAVVVTAAFAAHQEAEIPLVDLSDARPGSM